MWVEIDLVPDVKHIEDLEVVLDQCERNNEGRKPAMIIADHTQQLGLFVGVEPVFEMPKNVLKHVHVLADRRLHGQCVCEQFSISVGEFL